MYKYKHKRLTIIYMVLLIVGMISFVSIGATFAYFQVEKAFSGTFKIGTIGANWYNDTNMLTSDNSYELALNRELTRGNADGTNITNLAGNADGNINIRSTADSCEQYLRFKASATIGKNLLKVNNYSASSASVESTNSYGTSVSTTEAGNSVTVTQTIYNQTESYVGDYNNGRFIILFDSSALVVGEQYTFSFSVDIKSNPMSTDKFFCLFNSSKANATINSSLGRYTVSFTCPEGLTCVEIRNRGVSGVFKNFQIEKGTTATKYESFLNSKNLFDPMPWATAVTTNGVTVQYLADEDCFVLNGTSTTSTSVGLKYINLSASNADEYTISTKYVSGTITRPSSGEQNAVAYLGKGNEINTYENWTNADLQEYDTHQTATLTANYITAFWFYFSPSITLNNYKVKIQLEKSAYVSEYEPYGDLDGEVDVAPYLTFRYISGLNTFVVGSDTFWKKGGDGYYYYINNITGNCLQAGSIAPIFNNIVLSGDYPTDWIGRNMKIVFTYESLQVANNPVSIVWGNSASSALGLV